MNQPLIISFNISVRNLMHPNFLNELKQAMINHGVPGEYLELEVTEGTLMANPELSVDVLNSVRALNINISIDDFGTGYSSFAYLKNLPADTLKIDRSFVYNCCSDSRDRAIVNFAHIR